VLFGRIVSRSEKDQFLEASWAKMLRWVAINEVSRGNVVGLLFSSGRMIQAVNEMASVPRLQD
jgi:hypothetical protein